MGLEASDVVGFCLGPLSRSNDGSLALGSCLSRGYKFALFLRSATSSYPTALKGCRGIVFTHGVRIGGRALGKSLSGLYLRNRKV